MQLQPAEQYPDKRHHAAFNDGSTIHGWTNVQPRREGLPGGWKRERVGVSHSKGPCLGMWLSIKMEQTRGDGT